MTRTATWLPLLVGYSGLMFWAACLYDFSRTDPRDFRAFNKPTWVVPLVLGNVFGGLLWLYLGRPQRRGPHR
ncbi:MAG: PLDc N-terminal domain-containing protein [Mycobacteriaceae bacterium]